MYDLLGLEWTLVSFVGKNEGDSINTFADVAEQRNFPLEYVVLRGDNHAHKIWKRGLVLMGPDTHVV